MPELEHIPVLLNEVLAFLDPKPGQHFLDGTLGLGGHAAAILERTGPDGRLIGFDRDPRNVDLAARRLAVFGARTTIIHDSYARVLSYAHAIPPLAGILLDLGFSSVHIQDAGRGFSFQTEGPLDMRYDAADEGTAEQIVNAWEEEDLARIFRLFGEEPHARRIANAIVQERKRVRILTTTQLAGLIASVVPRHGKIHPATRVFQALRIAVNDELGELERALPALVSLLPPRGRIAVISFHSLEDRIVKRFFANRPDLLTLTKHIVSASAEENKINPRARSAKLRVAERIGREGFL